MNEKEAKCPCNLRDYMTMDDCDNTHCDYCCPLVAAAADVCPLTEDELSEMVKQNGGKPVVVFMYGIDEDGTLALDYGEWGMFDGRYFVCAGVEDNLRGYGDRFVAYKEPLPEKETAADACPLTGCGGGDTDD